VIGFFDTIYWSRRFRRASSRVDSRMGAPPQISVPEIYVENPDDTAENGHRTLPRDFTETPPVTPSRGAQRASSSSDYALGRALSTKDTSIGRSDARSNSPAELEASPNRSSHLTAQRLQAVDTSYHGAGAGARPESPGRLSPSPGPSHSRQGSSVSALGMLDSLDNSAWGESIRRSFTMRRPNSPS
jgi:voltage-dependent calcium channel